MTNLRRLDLNLLTVFDTVMAEKNMSRAADKIGMSQPALSLAVSRLRKIVGDPLFVRSGHGVKPTPKAQDMALPISKALQIISEAFGTDNTFDISSSNRHFNLALGDAGDLLILPHLMKHIEAHKSNIQIDTVPLQSDNAKKRMLLGEIDLCLWIEPFDVNEKGICSQKIAIERNVCVVRKDHPISTDSLTYEQYSEQNHIVLGFPKNYGATVIDRELWQSNFKRGYSVKVHNLHAYPRILNSTNLVATLPYRVALKFADEHDLRIIESPIKHDLPIYLSWPEIFNSDPGHQWLRNLAASFYQTYQPVEPID